MDEDDRIILAQITITKYLDDTIEGGVAVETDYSDGLPLIEALGLLTFATLSVPEDYYGDEADDN